MDIQPRRPRIGSAPEQPKDRMRMLFGAVAAVSALVLAAFFYMDGSGSRGGVSAFQDSLEMPGSGLSIPKHRSSDFMKPRRPRDYLSQGRNLEPLAPSEREADGAGGQTEAPATRPLAEGISGVQDGPATTAGKFAAVPSQGRPGSASASAGLFNQGPAAGLPAAPSPAAPPIGSDSIALAPAKRVDPAAAQAAAGGGKRALGEAAKAPKGAPQSQSLPSTSVSATGSGTTSAPTQSLITGSPLTGSKATKESTPGGGGSQGGGGGGSGGGQAAPPIDYCANSFATVDALSRQRSDLREENRLIEANVAKPGLRIIIKMDRAGGSDLNEASSALQSLNSALTADVAFFRPEFPAEAQELADLNTSVHATAESSKQGAQQLSSAAETLTAVLGQADMPQDAAQSAQGHGWSQAGFTHYQQTAFHLVNIQGRHEPRAAALSNRLEALKSNPAKSSWAQDGLGRVARQRAFIQRARAALKDSIWNHLDSFDNATASGLPEAIRPRKARLRVIQRTLRDMLMPKGESDPIQDHLNAAYDALNESEGLWEKVKISDPTQKPSPAAQGSERAVASLWDSKQTAGVIQRAEGKKQACTPPPPPAPPPGGK